VSEDVTETGKFFGEVESDAMNMLIKEQVFRKVHIFDYQAICLREDGSTSDASFVTKVSSALCGK
jgi:voltage-dependent calcium channel alpha-2/delta-3